MRIGEPLEVEGRDPLAVVNPIERDGKLAVVHAVAGELHVDGLGQRVLPQVPLPAFLVHGQHVIAAAQGVQQRPIGQALDGVVRAVVAAPALDAQQVAALVEVALVELATGGGVGPQDFALQERPLGRRHGRGDGDNRFRGGRTTVRMRDQDQYGNARSNDSCGGSPAESKQHNPLPACHRLTSSKPCAIHARLGQCGRFASRAEPQSTLPSAASSTRAVGCRSAPSPRAGRRRAGPCRGPCWAS